MENPTIGIKIADGTYFPILEEGNTKRKRLVLTTVNDNQESVQIDLYKGEGNELSGAVYVGSLLIENIVQGPKESSEIELKLGFDSDGTLNAEAGDRASGQFESLSISMETLGEALKYDIPEFSLDDGMEDLQINDEDLIFDEDEEFEGDVDDTLEEESSVPELAEGEHVEGFEDNLGGIPEVEGEDSTPESFSDSRMMQSKDKKNTSPILIALLVLIAIAAIAGISYLVFRSLQGENSPALEAQTETPSVVAEDAAPTVESTKKEHQSDETTTVPVLALQETNRVQDTSGVWYKIRWGDTLWGISYSFYDSPWNYKKIVKENHIKNPDIIFAETEIFIPSK